MGKATKMLYTVGKVFNIIEIILSVLGLTAGILAVVFNNDIGERLLAGGLNMINSVDGIRFTGWGLIVSSAIMLLVSSVVLALATRAYDSINNGRVDITPHVVMIVVGVFGNIFYLIGGVMGIFDESAVTGRPQGGI
ncbi:MAG: hypothetical protein IJ800_05330 [Clostridia bacterium]|nr:hypothetical protein [Clostridia bacterium]